MLRRRGIRQRGKPIRMGNHGRIIMYLFITALYSVRVSSLLYVCEVINGNKPIPCATEKRQCVEQ